MSDLDDARDLYAGLGVVEYWMFDPSGGDHYGFALRGETLVDGEYGETGYGSRRGRQCLGPQPRTEPGTALAGRSSAASTILLSGRWLENIEEAVARAESDRSEQSPPKPAPRQNGRR